MRTTDDQLGKLVRRLRAREPEVMADLYDLYGRLLYVLIVRIVRNPSVAEDLVQECFLRAWNRSQQLNEVYDAVGPWLTAIARNCALDYLRSSQANLRAPTPMEEAKLAAAPVDDEVVASERARIVKDAFRILSKEQKLVIELSYYEGLSQSAIAEKLDQPLGTVKGWARSALSRLRGTLDPSLVDIGIGG